MGGFADVWAFLRRGQAAVILLIGATVVVLPGGLNRFVLLKLAVAAFAAGLALLATATGSVPRRWWAVLVFGAAALCLSAAVSSEPLNAWWGRAPRFEGALVLSVYLLALVAGARLLGSRSDPGLRRLAYGTLAVAACAVGALSALEAVGIRLLSTNVDRPGSLLGNASDQAAWAVLALGVLLVRALRSRDRLAMLGSTAAAVAVVLSGSRAGALATIAAAGIAAMFSGAVTRRAWATMAALAAGAIALVVANPAVSARWTLSDTVAESSLTGRAELWAASWRMLTGSPLTGQGPSGYVDALPAVHDVGWYVRFGVYQPPDSPHNVLLQGWSAGGVLLVIAMVAALVLAGGRVVGVVRTRVDQPSWIVGSVAGLAGYAILLLTHFTSPGPTALAAVLLGSLIAEGRRPEPPWPRLVAATAAATLGLVLMMGAMAELPLRSAVESLALGSVASAEDSFQTAQRLRPWDRDLAAIAGHAFVIAARQLPGAQEPAQRWLDLAAAQTPGAWRVWRDRASLNELQGDYTAAEEALGEALGLAPHNPELLMRRGVVAGQAGRYDDAERYLLEASVASPQSPEPWQNLAVLYRLMQMPEAASAAQRKADALASGVGSAG